MSDYIKILTINVNELRTHPLGWLGALDYGYLWPARLDESFEYIVPDGQTVFEVIDPPNV